MLGKYLPYGKQLFVLPGIMMGFTMRKLIIVQGLASKLTDVL